MIWYRIWYDIGYDMIYLLTAVGLTPAGSTTVHIYKQKIHRTTQWNRIHRTAHKELIIHKHNNIKFIIYKMKQKHTKHNSFLPHSLGSLFSSLSFFEVYNISYWKLLINISYIYIYIYIYIYKLLRHDASEQYKKFFIKITI